MDHIEFGRMLDNYEDLSDNDKQLMEAHAKVCEECRRELEFYRSIMKAAASLPVIEPPADLLDKVNSQIDSMPKRNARFSRAAEHFRIYRVQYATAAACLAVGLIVGLNSGVIREKLDPAAPDGVISTTTRVSDNDDRALDDYELTEDEPATTPEAAPEATERVVAQLPVQTARPEAELPVRAAKPKAAARIAAATAKPAAPATRSASRPAAAKPAATKPAAAQPAASVTTPEAAAPAAVITEAPAAPTEKATKSRYTIAKGNYHVPETAQANIEVTDPPAAKPDTEIEGERYQIAMGSYELPEEEKKALAANKLIVNESDIAAIIACMNSSWVRGTNGGYTATPAAFANFLAKLDAEGIYYNYIQLSDTSSEIYFVLMAN